MSTFFSIIIPCYNQAHFLSDCLNSLLVQEFQDWEAIVVNDGSTDATNAVALSYTKTDSRIKLVTQPNGGLSAARNQGIRSASGERFIFLDADDFLYKDCLKEIANLIPTIDFKTIVQYGYTYVTENNDSELQTVLPISQKELLPSIFSSVLGPCHTICLSKKLRETIGFFDESLLSLEDWDFWLRVAKAGGKKITIDKSLAYYRYVKSSMSRNAFIMYNSFKEVMQRAPIKDLRIIGNYPTNKHYDFDSTHALKEALLRFLGVSIMQGDIDKSIVLFQKESPKKIIAYNPIEFEQMCSYLSFRYWYTKADLKFVFTEIYPNFYLFFRRMGLSNQSIKIILFHIFKRHYYCQNTLTYGKTLGSLFNFLLRLKYK